MKKLLFSPLVIYVPYVLFVSLLLKPSEAEAQTNRFSILHTQTATTSQDGIVTQASVPLDSGVFEFSTQLDYAYRPLELTANGARVTGIVDHLWVEYFKASVGLLPRWDVAVNLPVIWRNRFNAPTNLQTNFETRKNLGDLMLESRIQIADRSSTPLGIAFAGFLTLPTGNETDFTSDSQVTGGAKIIVDQKIGERFLLAGNLGTHLREHVVYQDYESEALFEGSFGANLKATDRLNLKGDLFIMSPWNSLMRATVNTPLEILAAAQYTIPKAHLTLNAGGSKGIVRGVGTPDWRAFAGIAYTLNIHK